jgi:serine/threonine protein kinase
MVLESGRSVGPYEILGVLGSGGMGTVYLARDTRLDRRVALKFIQPAGVVLDDEESGRQMLHEARAASALSHPN